MIKQFKRHRDYVFFDQDIRLSKLTKLGDPLIRLTEGVDFELFRCLLEDSFYKQSKNKGGRRPYNYILMFKICILQRYYNLSDDQAEFQINDRMSFMRFLDLTISDDIPDSKTIWNFTEKLKDLSLAKPLFDLFLEELNKLNLIVNEGKIVDASFVEAPRQRNSREENKHIKEEGKAPDQWKGTPSKLAQKDVNARWTKKNNQNYFGYKNHTKIDSGSKLIDNYSVSDASVHDSQAMEGLFEEKDASQPFYADSAYTGPKQEETIKKYEMKNEVHEKGYKNSPLTEEQKASNTEKSRTRARVEHIFGFMEMNMGGMFFRKVGIKRAETMIGLMNLTYNMFRKIQLHIIQRDKYVQLNSN